MQLKAQINISQQTPNTIKPKGTLRNKRKRTGRPSPLQPVKRIQPCMNTKLHTHKERSAVEETRVPREENHQWLVLKTVSNPEKGMLEPRYEPIRHNS